MKRLLPLLLLLFSLNVIAQDYACIIPSDTSYFINADGYLRGIRIDNVSWIGTDTIYYPFKTKRYYSTAWSTPAFDNSDGCWLGRQIIKKTDGKFHFRTLWNDTIAIDTRAMPGDSWDFYSDTTLRHYLATVMSVDTLTIKGVVDSVKKIQITAYLGSSVNFGDSVHGFELMLSKKHGFVAVFDLYMFPYFSPSGVTYSDVFSQQVGAILPDNFLFRQVDFRTPTLKDVNDYNVGDVFVTAGGRWNLAGSYSWKRYDSIVSKSTTPYNTTYTSYQKIRSNTVSWGTSSDSYNEGSTSLYFDTTSTFFLTTMPEEYPNLETVWYYRPNDTSCSEGSYYSRKRIITFEGCPNYLSYKIGFPTVSLKEQWTNSTTDYLECAHTWSELRFSVKGSVSCGDREYVSPIKVEEVTGYDKRFKFYPNPANETLNLIGIRETTDIIISDITGRQIITFHTTANETSIDISQLTPGTYIIRVNDMRQTFTKQ